MRQGRLQHEIDTYAHLVPDGTNWKATLLIELPDAQERERELPQLNEAAHRLYVDVPQHRRVYAVFGPEIGGPIHALSLETRAE